jgi:LytS/YehU family sensor histidine kinase
VDDGFGRVELNARMEAGDLVVCVRNTAPPNSDPSAWKDNVGLASVRARIADACTAGSGLEFSKPAEGMVQALLRIKQMAARDERTTEKLKPETAHSR